MQVYQATCWDADTYANEMTLEKRKSETCIIFTSFQNELVGVVLEAEELVAGDGVLRGVAARISEGVARRRSRRQRIMREGGSALKAADLEIDSPTFSPTLPPPRDRRRQHLEDSAYVLLEPRPPPRDRLGDDKFGVLSAQASESGTAISDDELYHQVVGPERHGRTRGYGFGPTPSTVFGTTLGRIELASQLCVANTQNIELRSKIDNLEKKIEDDRRKIEERMEKKMMEERRMMEERMEMERKKMEEKMEEDRRKMDMLLAFVEEMNRKGNASVGKLIGKVFLTMFALLDVDLNHLNKLSVGFLLV
ncbi:hypothetical protein CRG98_037297 [Punica granatum]|uniref:Uncharacterized protein n=1 Tax=Punica granatum TaxID=22663 RepID=A0A2I0IG42_PUNGR|nr:hypothetical protein CRG98_037297 [Punica granatum]